MSQLPKLIKIIKNVGETPLEALERFRVEQIEKNPDLASTWKSVPMTYAGRLDPMAEGELLILIGDECKNKETYLGLDKEYIVEIVFGIYTDTYDALGLAEIDSNIKGVEIDKLDLTKYAGKFVQEYPPYSSKKVGGKQLHELARSNELPEEIPKREVEIYEIELLDSRKMSAAELQTRIIRNIDLVKGDFRQEEIRERWNKVLGDPEQLFDATKIRVKCSSGTYMRSLADRIGKELQTTAFALSIKRTKINTL